jgi:mitochondrial fission protein ELM1
MLRDETSPVIWVLTDGKAGDELQALSVAEALGLPSQIRRVKPEPPFTWPGARSIRASGRTLPAAPSLRPSPTF